MNFPEIQLHWLFVTGELKKESSTRENRKVIKLLNEVITLQNKKERNID